MIKKIFIFISFIFILIIGLWHIVISNELLHNIVKNYLKSKNLELECKGFHKGLFYKLNIDQIKIKKNKNTLFFCQNFSIYLNPFYLFKFNIKLPFKGFIEKGKFKGNLIFNPLRKSSSFYLYFFNIKIENLPFFYLLNLEGKGIIKGEIKIINSEGSAIFNIAQSKLILKNILLPLPLSIFHTIQGNLKFSSNEIYISSLTAEGQNIYVELKGKIINKIAHLYLEIQTSSYLALLKKYEISPGYYKIPLNFSIGQIKIRSDIKNK